MIDRETIIHILENFGLSAYEAKAYLAILSERPLTGYKLSKVSGVPRSRIYETIEKLTNKGLIVSQKGEKTLLRAVGLESFLKKKEKENKQNIDLLRKTLSRIESSGQDQGIWNIYGRNQILEIIGQLISNAKKHIYLLGFSDDLLNFETHLGEAKKRKVRIYGVYCGEKPLQVKNFYSHQGQVCSICQEIALSFDSTQALVGCTFPSEEATAALTKNRGIVYIIEQYIKHEIFISQIFQISERPSSDKLRKMYQQVIAKLP